MTELLSSTKGWFSVHIAARAFGYESVDVMPKMGLYLRNIGNGPEVLIEQALGALADRLPHWIDPRDWLEYAALKRTTLVPYAQAVAQLGVNSQTHPAWLEALTVPYVLRYDTDGATPMLMQGWVNAYLRRDRPCGGLVSQLLFGVKTANWAAKGKLQCLDPTHEHQNEPYWRYGCWLLYLQQHIALEYRSHAVTFWADRLGTGDRLVSMLTIAQAATRARVNRQKLVNAVEDGEFPTITHPGGLRVIAPWWVGRLS